MTEPTIEVVLFDVGNVIVRATHAITHVILEDYGIAPEVARRFFANEDYADFARGKLTGEEFAYRTRRRLGSTLAYDQIRCAHDAHIYAKDEEVVAMLRALRERGVRLAFATDTNEWQTARERELVNLAAYGRVFRSHDLGALKVDGGVFERILAELDEEPSHVLFVDDSPEKVARAAALDMVTHRFTSAAALRDELIRCGLRD